MGPTRRRSARGRSTARHALCDTSAAGRTGADHHHSLDNGRLAGRCVAGLETIVEGLPKEVEHTGRSLSCVGVHLALPCFAHGQLYVAVSCVGDPAGVCFAVRRDPDLGFVTRNVVYAEALTI